MGVFLRNWTNYYFSNIMINKILAGIGSILVTLF